MSEPERPPPPIIGKVTHHNIELYWDEAFTKLNQTAKKGDGRIRVTVQEQDKNGDWGNVYTGYAKRYVIGSLEPWSQYMYRMRFMNDHGNSEWSPSTTVSTTKEPLTGEDLHKAIFLQNLERLKDVLDTGDVKVDTPDKYGFTPLMQAAQKGYLEMVETLLEKGADVNAQNEAGKSALMLACYAGQTEIVKTLVKFHGASTTLQDRGGSTALHWAMDGGNLELIDWMLDNGASISATDYNGWTPLLRVAAVGGNSRVAELLLRCGAEMDARDKDGKSALMIAVVNGHEALVELLLERGADLSVKSEFGKSAYEMALSMERRRVIKALEEHMDKVGIKYHH